MSPPPEPLFVLGCGRLGSILTPLDDAQNLAFVRRAYELGVRHFDTASIYGQGDSERLLGRALEAVRAEVHIATKAGQALSPKQRLLRPFKPLIRGLVRRHAATAAVYAGSGGPAPAPTAAPAVPATAATLVAAQRAQGVNHCFDPAFVLNSLRGSLRRLRSEQVELFYLHSPAPQALARPELWAALGRAGRACRCHGHDAGPASGAQPAPVRRRPPGAAGRRGVKVDAASLAEGQPLRARVCIVGVGAAGITLASELDGSGLDVVLLDSGPDSDPYEGQADAPHPPPSQYRRLGWGGTTGLWGGRCVPFDPIDFERREHVPDSGWPIGYAEVAAHYPAAMAYCDAGRNDFTASGSPVRPQPLFPGVAHPSLVLDRLERYSLPAHFGRRHDPRLVRSTNIRVLKGAHVLRLHPAATGPRIEALDFVDAARRQLRCEADIFVLAMGGLETVRLLLASNLGGPGLGNRSGHLGRYFQIDDSVQRQEWLLNIAFRLHYPDRSDPAQGSSDGVRAPLQRHLRNAVTGLLAFLAFGVDWTRRRVLARRKPPYVLVTHHDGSYPLDFNAEQVPLRDSRVELIGERDRHGVPRLAVRWRKCEADVDGIWRAFQVLRTGLEATGQCTLAFEPQALRAALEAAGPVGGHHIGTARMAAHGGAGVVDAQCALFDFPNLHLASAAVFPTSSHANPTLTIVAMAVRLAAHLRRQAGRVPQVAAAG